MVRLSKIYTKSGDAGTTGLVGGERIQKSALRIEAFGTVDELNSIIGVVRTHAQDSAHVDMVKEAGDTLRRIQNDLFDIGSLLATAPGSKWEGMREMKSEHVTFLEVSMDRYLEVLEALPSFVLPGGSVLNAHAHVGRTVCRRCERLLWRLHDDEPVDPVILTYINRLSDYLFVFSRWAAVTAGEEEYLWDTEISRGE